MKTESLLMNYEFQDIFKMHSNELLLSLLEAKAEIKSHAVNNELFKDLVGKYAQSERELVHLNQLKNKFLGMAAHDLRNPITAIRGFSQLLSEGALGEVREEQKDFIDRIYQASEDMLRLLNELLDISVIESGKLNFNKRPTCLKKLIEGRIHICNVSAEKKAIEIIPDLKEIGNSSIDQDKIVQAVDNYITNAIKFSDSGSKVYVCLKKVGKSAVVSVRDEGQGIPESEQGDVFKEFKTTSARPTAGEKSTGLGLSIVKKFVEGHGGEVSLKSSPGKGSTFTFKIPMEAKK